jgi:hypothetical protein
MGARLCAVCAAAAIFTVTALTVPARGTGDATARLGADALMMRVPEPASPDVKVK